MRKRSEAGSLLLDTLTAILVIAITFAVGYPNYMRGVYETNVTVDAANLDAINIATIRYATDHNGNYPTHSNISATYPGATYLPEVPISPIGYNVYDYGTPVSPAPYVIFDANQFNGSNQTDPALLSNYHRVDGSACASGDRLAVDNVHGTYCDHNQ